MKLLVFAHTPPPHHGQSQMVEWLLAAWGGDRRRQAGQPQTQPASNHGAIECFHVNARLSRDLDDIGRRPWAKVPLLLKFCMEALWCRVRYGVANFYYVPAPPQRGALYRDWLVLVLCRPFFKRLIFHWHAAGLGAWLQTEARPWERWISRRLLGKADLSIVQSRANDPDLDFLNPRAIAAIPYGLPDPAATLAGEIERRRKDRLTQRQQVLTERASNAGATDGLLTFRILFLALCTRSKGLFIALDAVAELNRRWTQEGRPARCKLVVAGKFAQAEERAEFDRRAAQPDLQLPTSGGGTEPAVEYAGFASGAAKERLFLEADVFCFPTYYEAESFGLVLVEAMAYGLPIVTTRWRCLPELFPKDYPGLVDPRSAAPTADALAAALATESGLANRQWYLDHYQWDRFVSAVTTACLKTV